jgi:DNA-directed RNA polymerase specialized sigma24 family protein
LLGRLPPLLVSVLELRYFDGLTWAAIGMRLGRSPAGARVTHRRALAALCVGTPGGSFQCGRA